MITPPGQKEGRTGKSASLCPPLAGSERMKTYHFTEVTCAPEPVRFSGRSLRARIVPLCSGPAPRPASNWRRRPDGFWPPPHQALKDFRKINA